MLSRFLSRPAGLHGSIPTFDLPPSFTVKLDFSLIDSDDALRTPAIRQSWTQQTEASTDLNALYASPEWCESKFGKDASRRSCVAILTDPSERIVGLAPVEVGPYALPFSLLDRLLWRIRLRAAKVLGSLPMLPDDPGAYDCFLRGLFREMGDIDCVYMDCVAVDSFASRILQEGGRPDGEFAVYSPSGKRRWHWITLAGSFDQYLKGMSSKSRKNLRRIAEGLGSDSAENPRIRRIDTETQVDEFLDRALIVSRNSWQHRILGPRIRKDPEEVHRMRHLARLGILRSYLLESGDQPCAFIVGYQFRGIFHYAEIGFDQAFARLSPGSILLYQAIKDLHDVNPPKIVNFGMGDATYKSRFGNTSCEDATMLVLRRTPRLRLAIAAHAGFRSAVGLGKKWTSRIFPGYPARSRRT